MKPTIKTGMKNGGAVSTIKDQLVNTVKDKANEEAQKILADAQAQVDKIKAEAQVVSDKLKEEGYEAADKQVEDVKNPLAKIAAKKAAEVAKKEVDKKAQKVLDEAEIKVYDLLGNRKNTWSRKEMNSGKYGDELVPEGKYTFFDDNINRRNGNTRRSNFYLFKNPKVFHLCIHR